MKALKTSEVAERFAALGVEITGGTPQEFLAFLKTEIDRWARVVKAAGGIKPE